MKKYAWILFDVDDTLFHFDAFLGLKTMFRTFGVDFSEQDYQHYLPYNKGLWNQYQNGQISVDELKQQRFQHWAKKLNTSTLVLEAAFQESMYHICTPFDGADSLLNCLKGRSKLGIITNGFVQMQKIRLSNAGLLQHFDILVTSEEVGVAKPNPGIFEHTFAKIGLPCRDEILMVGDNLDADILGGIGVGIDTCWLNPKNIAAPAGISPSYQVSSLFELECLLMRAFELR